MIPTRCQGWVPFGEAYGTQATLKGPLLLLHIATKDAGPLPVNVHRGQSLLASYNVPSGACWLYLDSDTEVRLQSAGAFVSGLTPRG